MDAGDVAALEQLLARHPELARERLKRPGPWLTEKIGGALKGFFKHPYLLWFLTEDAPRNGDLSSVVGAAARAIIAAARRAKVRSLDDQLESTLHFAVCSPIGRESGRQIQLIDALVDEGAPIPGGVPEQALICRNPAAARHLLTRGAALTLGTAACLDLWDDVTRLGRTATKKEKQVALALAALNGRPRGLAMLLELDVVVSAYATGFYTHATPLHHAVDSSVLEAVQVLVKGGARLDMRDKAYDGTPLGWAEHMRNEAGQGSARRQQYDAIANYLRELGAPE